MMTPSRTASSAWIETLALRTRPAARLLLFHYAGASAAVFRPWLDSLPADIDVLALQLPGRDRRQHEPLMSCASGIAAQALPEVAPLCGDGVPLVFAGHSIGALIAFEVARKLQAQGRGIEHLLVSARRAPHLPAPVDTMHDLPSEVFIERLKVYDGTPQAILQDTELMAYFLPRLRADFAVSETYRFCQGPLLGCPITALAGDTDHEAPMESVFAWRYQTDKAFRFIRVQGGHFFIHQQRAAFMNVLNEVLRSASSWAGTSSHAGSWC